MTTKIVIAGCRTYENYEEAKASLAKFATQIPEEYIQSKYLEQAYENREVYLIGGKHFLLKKTRADGTPYLFAID